VPARKKKLLSFDIENLEWLPFLRTKEREWNVSLSEHGAMFYANGDNKRKRGDLARRFFHRTKILQHHRRAFGSFVFSRFVKSVAQASRHMPHSPFPSSPRNEVDGSA
jgi:hypothetical protein